MSFFSNLFSGWGGGGGDDKKPPPNPPNPGGEKSAAAVIDQNFAHQETLEDKADQAEHEAKKCLARCVELTKKGDARGADVQKKRAAMYRKQATTLRLQANNLIQQGIVLDEASSNAAVHETMQDSLRTGQSLIKHIDPSEVAETAEDWADLYAESREVGRAMSNPLSLGDGASDEEQESILDAEIAQLMETQSLQEAEDVPLPDVPKHVPIKSGNSGGGGSGPNGNVGVKVTPKTSLMFSK